MSEIEYEFHKQVWNRRRKLRILDSKIKFLARERNHPPTLNPVHAYAWRRMVKNELGRTQKKVESLGKELKDMGFGRRDRQIYYSRLKLAQLTGDSKGLNRKLYMPTCVAEHGKCLKPEKTCSECFGWDK